MMICTWTGFGAYGHRRSERDLLADYLSEGSQRVAICGPRAFVTDVSRWLEELGGRS